MKSWEHSWNTTTLFKHLLQLMKLFNYFPSVVWSHDVLTSHQCGLKFTLGSESLTQNQCDTISFHHFNDFSNATLLVNNRFHKSMMYHFHFPDFASSFSSSEVRFKIISKFCQNLNVYLSFYHMKQKVQLNIIDKKIYHWHHHHHHHHEGMQTAQISLILFFQCDYWPSLLAGPFESIQWML